MTVTGDDTTVKSSTVKNVTVTLEPGVARWARVRAAEQEMSLSRYLGELLRREMDDTAAYRAAMQEYLGREPMKLRDDASPLPGRDELHER